MFNSLAKRTQHLSPRITKGERSQCTKTYDQANKENSQQSLEKKDIRIKLSREIKYEYGSYRLFVDFSSSTCPIYYNGILWFYFICGTSSPPPHLYLNP
jgi:hypothetical protein